MGLAGTAVATLLLLASWSGGNAMPMICPGSSRAAWILPHVSVDTTLKAYQCSYEGITKQTE